MKDAYKTCDHTLIYEKSYVGDEDDRTPSSWKQFAPVYPAHPLTFLGRFNNFGTSYLIVIPSPVLYARTSARSTGKGRILADTTIHINTLCACVRMP